MNLISKLMDLSMTSALQRLIPAEQDADRAHAIFRAALLIGVMPAIAMAGIIHSQAATIAGFLSPIADHAIEGRTVIYFAWVLPLWTFLEVAPAPSGRRAHSAPRSGYASFGSK